MLLQKESDNREARSRSLMRWTGRAARSPMMSVLGLAFLSFRTCVRSQAARQLELLALRHQLHVLARSRRRPRLSLSLSLSLSCHTDGEPRVEGSRLS